VVRPFFQCETIIEALALEIRSTTPNRTIIGNELFIHIKSEFSNLGIVPRSAFKIEILVRRR
jgi:hypothetical protein